MSEHGKHEADSESAQGESEAGGASSDAEGRFRAPSEDEGLSALAKDAAHPFDQTNGIVDGLEGDADDPEKMDEKLDDNDRERAGRAPGFPVAGSSGGQPGVAPAPVIGRQQDRQDSDTEEPQGP